MGAVLNLKSAWSRAAWAGVMSLGLVVGGCGREAEQSAGSGPSSTPATVSGAFGKLSGRWLRPDGGYLLEVRQVEAGGDVAIAYFNPRPIHVSNAKAVSEGGRLKLFVELKDTGYPGCTYDLAYDGASDRLVGTYYQAALGQTFDVVFEREQ